MLKFILQNKIYSKKMTKIHMSGKKHCAAAQDLLRCHVITASLIQQVLGRVVEAPVGECRVYLTKI